MKDRKRAAGTHASSMCPSTSVFGVCVLPRVALSRFLCVCFLLVPSCFIFFSPTPYQSIPGRLHVCSSISLSPPRLLSTSESTLFSISVSTLSTPPHSLFSLFPLSFSIFLVRSLSESESRESVPLCFPLSCTHLCTCL